MGADGGREPLPVNCTHLKLNNRQLVGRMRSANWCSVLPGRKPSYWELGVDEVLCSWQYESGVEFLPHLAGKAVGGSDLGSVIMDSCFSYPILYIFLSKCFFICGMPWGTFPETLSVFDNFHQFHWEVGPQNFSCYFAGSAYPLLKSLITLYIVCCR